MNDTISINACHCALLRTIQGDVTTFYMGSEKIILEANKREIFIRTIARKLQKQIQEKKKIYATTEDKDFLESYARQYCINLPCILLNEETSNMSNTNTNDEIILGSSSNNQLDSQKVKILKESHFKKGDKNRLYFNCLDENGQKFSYYIDLAKGGRRYPKLGSEPSSFIRFNDLKSLELSFLGLASEEQLFAKYAS